VESITIDMNAGYVNVIKEIFPQAKIIIDRFHLVQLITRSMNKTRVRVMNTFKTSNGEDMKKYRRLKRYWKLLLKNEEIGRASCRDRVRREVEEQAEGVRRR